MVWWTVLLPTQVYGYLFETLLSIFLGLYPDVGLLDPSNVFNSPGSRHTVVHRAAAPFYVPAISCARTPASLSPPAFVRFCVFDTGHPHRRDWPLLSVGESEDLYLWCLGPWENVRCIMMCFLEVSWPPLPYGELSQDIPSATQRAGLDIIKNLFFIDSGHALACVVLRRNTLGLGLNSSRMLSRHRGPNSWLTGEEVALKYPELGCSEEAPQKALKNPGAAGSTLWRPTLSRSGMEPEHL